jgi:hypothetical protein
MRQTCRAVNPLHPTYSKYSFTLDQTGRSFRTAAMTA